MRVLPRTILLFALFPVLAGTVHAAATIIIFKDGFAVYGKLKREHDVIQGVQIPRGPYYIDDGVRRFTFSHTLIEEGAKKDPPPAKDTVRLERVPGAGTFRMESIVELLESTPFDGKWERQFKFLTKVGDDLVKRETPQRLVAITPWAVRVDFQTYAFSSMYFTQELGPELVRKLLATHPELRDKDPIAPKGEKLDPVKRRFRVFQFQMQAGWYDEAEAELAAIKKDLPDEKEKIYEGEQELKKLRAVHLASQIEVAALAGRHKFAQDKLNNFPEDTVDQQLAGKLRKLKGKYEASKQVLTEVEKHLLELGAQVADKPQNKFLPEAIKAILDELTHENLLRLEPFVAQARLAERDRKQGDKPPNSPEEILALAVTGWLMGKDGAENTVDVADRTWKARQFVLEYLRTNQAGARSRLLQAFAAQKSLAQDELAHLITLLPPGDPFKNVNDQPRLEQTESGVSYLVQLPPEYRVGRSYPLLFVLCEQREQPKDILDRFSKMAGERGYVLVAPTWVRKGNKSYQYSAEEHRSVLDVLATVRRHVQVDSDRVFVMGYGEGANMALDVGLSHPDLFAGVLSMSAYPRFYVQNYWTNCQYLPLYVTAGDSAGKASEAHVDLFKKYMIEKHCPVTFVEYKGRGMEWFSAELPTMFDWMRFKKRMRPVPELGKKDREFRTMRTTDNRFYWITLDNIAPSNDIAKWSWDRQPALVMAKISDGNRITLDATGMKKASVWLTRDMVDFTKPVLVSVNGANKRKPVEYKVQPNLLIMLEDLYDRGDKQKLFVARIDLDVP